MRQAKGEGVPRHTGWLRPSQALRTTSEPTSGGWCTCHCASGPFPLSVDDQRDLGGIQEAMFAEDIEHQLLGYSVLRPATVRNYRNEMRLWFHFIGRTAKADSLTHDDVDGFRTRMAQHGYAVHSARRAINTVRRVMRWAHGREMVERDRLETYHFRVGKDAQVLEPGEYGAGEIMGVLRQLNPRKPRYWRPWAEFLLATETG